MGWETSLPASIDTTVARVGASLAAADIAVTDRDLTRPWGGFLVISAGDIDKFVGVYFPGAGIDLTGASPGLSPKILLVAPGHRLSWQYHLRRSEIWRVLEGPVGISRSPSDVEPALCSYAPGELVRLDLGERHRLAGLADWGVVAEIWQHADGMDRSDEHDIVRVTDDHGRA